MPLLYVLFFFSGASGLIYEVIWVREFGNVFGNTIYSASLVIAVFMSGLGIGSYVMGMWADRRYRSAPESFLRAYGFCELAIGGMGFLISLLLPRLAALSATISSYTQAANGWYFLSTGSYLARYAIAVAVLAPITMLMGGTLTLLIRHLLHRDLDTAGWKIGALYGINTAGAAAGAFLTDYAFVPSAGLGGTQRLAVLLNFIAAFGALRLASRGRRDSEGEGDPPPRRTAPRAAAEPAASSGVVVLTGLALLFSGLAAMGMEIVWFRHIASLLGSLRSVFSLLLTVILIGIWLGSMAGGYLHRRFGQPVLLYVLSQALFAISTLLGLGTADITQMLAAGNASAPTFLSTSGWMRSAVELWVNVQPPLREVAIPALFMGFTYPLANAGIQRVQSAVGRRAGLLYLANTLGAVLGSLLTGFVLLPSLGMQHSVTLLITATMAAIVPLYFAFRPSLGGNSEQRRLTGGFILSFAAIGTAMLLWLSLPANHLLGKTLLPLRPHERRLVVSEGLTEILSVTETPTDGRELVTNGHPMAGTNWRSQRYMRAFAHLPLLSREHPERVLVIGFGVGNTLHAASLHPSIRRIELADLSPHILEHAHYFADTNHDVLKYPKLSVYINDGRQHLRVQPEGTYDLITLEPPPIAQAGVASLYSREFLELARSRLKRGGYLTLWLPAYQVPEDTTLSMVRAFVDVFPASVLLSGALSELILMGVNDSKLEIDPARVEARLRAAPAVREDMDKIYLGTLTEIIGTFAAGAQRLTSVTDAFPPVTDDYPIPEYAIQSRLMVNRIPSQLFDVKTVAVWCPKCFDHDKPFPALVTLGTYLDVLARLYQDPLFLETSSIVRLTPYTRIRVRVDPATQRTIAASPYLRLVFRIYFLEAK